MPTATLAVYDTLADWEPGHLVAELRTGRLTGAPFEVTTVGIATEPVTTMGGVRIAPDAPLATWRPEGVDLLILPGAAFWDEAPAEGESWAAAAAAALAAGTRVAAICGATAGLARAGLLDERRHTSADPRYLAATGYAGGRHYADARAVTDDGLTTAGPQSPVFFAAEVLRALGLAPDAVLDAYVAVMQDGDAAAYERLASAQR